jgi:hypothetical protein
MSLVSRGNASRGRESDVPTKKEIDAQIKELETQRESASDDTDDVEVYRVPKSSLGKGALQYLFGDDSEEENEEENETEEEEENEEEEPKKEPKPKPRNKYFGG